MTISRSGWLEGRVKSARRVKMNDIFLAVRKERIVVTDSKTKGR